MKVLKARLHCSICKQYKNREKFGKDKKSPNSRRGVCDECVRGIFKRLSSKCGYQRRRDNIKRWFSYWKGEAKRRKKEFTLTKEEFEEIVKNPCSYCGEVIKFIGVDRVDNKLGYISGNSVACCGTCNFMKYTQTKENFISQCKKIANRF